MTQPDPALKRTPLHAAHVRAGARMIPFGGWDMPVQYAGIVEEHRTVRSAVGCFDVSHMGEFEFKGPDAVRALQRLTTNDVAALEIGQVQYSLLCYEDGGIVDDLTLYRLTDDHFMMTVNASNIDKDWAWVGRHLEGRVEARNVSQETGLIAVQGPHAERLVGRLADVDVAAIGYYRFAAATWPACRASSPGRATRGRTASSSTCPRREPRRSGSACWRRGRPTARPRSASAPGTRSGSR